MSNPDAQTLFWIIPSFGGFLAMVCLIFGWRAGKRQWLLNSLPTSKTTGVFIGEVELKGTAEIEAPLTSYLAGTSCVYFHWTVEEHWSRTVIETYQDSKGMTQTRTRTESGRTKVAEGGESPAFYLKDDSGIIRIVPTGAKLEPKNVFNKTCGMAELLYYGKGPQGAVPNSDHRRTFTEYVIPLHAPLYVIGQARERQDVVAPEIAADKRSPLFLISIRTEEQIAGSFRNTFWWLTVIGLILAVASFLLRDGMLHTTLSSDVVVFVLAGFSYLLVWFLGCAWILYNNLVEIRVRVRQGWANVDVQLKRRHELIPSLVNTVTGLKGYEQRVQGELAALRAQIEATAPGQPGPDYAGCLPKIKAVAEAYPELKANGAFVNLMKQLSDTEDRIAMARSYFNELASFYNARIESIPDVYVAVISGMEAEPLMLADGFERTPVGVHLAV
ncbi:MAG: LemA family protein [Candidatus Omnitrophota bacterium]